MTGKTITLIFTDTAMRDRVGCCPKCGGTIPDCCICPSPAIKAVTREERDWQGNAVHDSEPPETVIKVWAINPGVVGYDETWVREYARAVEVAGEILADLMDGITEEEAETEGVTITVKLRKTTAGEYADVREQEP